MVEATGLKLLHRGSLEWRHLPTRSHENLPRHSKVDVGGGGQTHIQDGYLINLFNFLEKRLKQVYSVFVVAVGAVRVE
jgi:hypothetical protein